MDCEHMEIELDSQPITDLATLTYAHWFTCTRCRLKACVVHTAVHV